MTTASIRITTADRDADGKITVETPRPLAELLPEPSDSAHVDSRLGSSISRDDESGDKVAPRRPSREQLLTWGGIAGGMAAAALLIALIGFTAPPAPALPDRPAPTAAPTAVATLAPTVAATTRIVVAFAAPNGDVLGGFDIGREQFTIVGRYGDDWAQIRRADGSEVWLRRGDVDGVGQDALASAPDLAPPTPRPAPVPAAAPIAPIVPASNPPADPPAGNPPVPTDPPAPTVDTLATTIARNQAAIDATNTAIAAAYARNRAAYATDAAGYPTVQARMSSGGVQVRP